jgi:hypothetical protein
MSIVELDATIQVAEELNEVEVRTVPFGTFAGTLNRLIVLQDKEPQPMDTGDQRGDRNRVRCCGRRSQCLRPFPPLGACLVASR